MKSILKAIIVAGAAGYLVSRLLQKTLSGTSQNAENQDRSSEDLADTASMSAGESQMEQPTQPYDTRVEPGGIH
jgi:hypothetical protein